MARSSSTQYDLKQLHVTFGTPKWKGDLWNLAGIPTPPNDHETNDSIIFSHGQYLPSNSVPRSWHISTNGRLGSPFLSVGRGTSMLPQSSQHMRPFWADICVPASSYWCMYVLELTRKHTQPLQRLETHLPSEPISPILLTCFPTPAFVQFLDGSQYSFRKRET